jgi:hypothetical protein
VGIIIITVRITTIIIITRTANSHARPQEVRVAAGGRGGTWQLPWVVRAKEPKAASQDGVVAWRAPGPHVMCGHGVPISVY